MDWVWRHSRTRGNARLAMLHVADQVRTLACEVRLSTADFMKALNVPSRDTASSAVKAAVKSGELEVKEPGRGSIPPLYRLPQAVGYRRGDALPVPDSGTGHDPGTTTPVPDLGKGETNLVPDSGTQPPTPPVPDSGTPRTGSREGLVPDFGPHYPYPEPRSEGASEQPAPGSEPIPDFARPLVDSCTLAGVHVRWNLNPDEWLKVHALIKRSGIQVLASYAQDQAATKRITYARYFLPGWTECPPLPLPSAQRPPLRAISGGYQPYQQPPESAFQNQQGF